MRQLKISKSITNRESASLDKYLQEIGHEELLSVDEEVELAQKIRKGDRRALERLTRANLRFVVSVAKQYQNQGLSLPTSLMREMLDSSKQQRNLMKHVDSNSFHTLFGGFAKAFCKPSLSRVESCACHSIRWEASTR